MKKTHAIDYQSIIGRDLTKIRMPHIKTCCGRKMLYWDPRVEPTNPTCRICLKKRRFRYSKRCLACDRPVLCFNLCRDHWARFRVVCPNPKQWTMGNLYWYLHFYQSRFWKQLIIEDRWIDKCA